MGNSGKGTTQSAVIHSMTGFGTASRELVPTASAPAQTMPSGTSATTDGAVSRTGGMSTSISVEYRSVNSRFLDLAFRMPDDLRVCEPELRTRLMATLARGKVEIRIHVQRSDAVAGARLDEQALVQLARLQQSVLSAFPNARGLNAGEILRWPGVMTDASIDATVLRDTVFACAREALDALLLARAREGAALTTVLLDCVSEMESIVERMTPWVPELVQRQQNKIVERLQEALSAIPGAQNDLGERIRQEVTMYGVKIDIAEELTRLRTHLAETRQMLAQGGKVGKRLDFMMQELNREANTLGSKAAVKEMADAAMALKLLIEQMREQVQNLE